MEYNRTFNFWPLCSYVGYFGLVLKSSFIHLVLPLRNGYPVLALSPCRYDYHKKFQLIPVACASFFVVLLLCFRGSAYARRRREREVEMESDDRDRVREKDELEELRLQVRWEL